MDKFFGFMEGPVGRALRIAMGLALILLGLGRIGGVGGLVVAVAGLLPVAMGAWGPCLVHLAMERLGGHKAI
jgi:uncharacterized membrane protein